MNPLFEALDDEHKKELKASPQPNWITPMLATLTKQRFSDSAWIFERKFDGERCLVFRKGDAIQLLSRNKKVLNTTYPELVEAFSAQEARDFIVDGEVVALEGDVTDFSKLQERIGITDQKKAEQSPIVVSIYLFDLLYFDGYDITGLELRTRKSLLANVLSYADLICYTHHWDGDGMTCYDKACRKGWEGIIAKRAVSRYVQRRSVDWLKFPCLNRQEFVIGGYTDPLGSRAGFGALLIGYYEGDLLKYSGRVGTGFNERMLTLLGGILALQEQKASPFADKRDRLKGEHWVSPVMVCEVAFNGWTESGKLRQPRFLGIRNDKDASQVVRE